MLCALCRRRASNESHDQADHETPRQGSHPTAEPSQEGPGKQAASQAPLATTGAGPISASSGEGASLQSLPPVPGFFCYYFCKMEQLEISSAQC